MYMVWSKMATLSRYANNAEIRISLFSFLNGFKFLRTEIIDDTLIITFKKSIEDETPI
jgi:hypothetical protein